MSPTRQQARSMVSFGSAAVGVGSAVRDLRRARSQADKLALVDAVLSLAAVLTGLALLVRALREDS